MTIHEFKEKNYPMASPSEWASYLTVCERLGIDPVSKMVCLIPKWNSTDKKYDYLVCVTINAMREIGQRDGTFCGFSETQYCYENGVWQSAPADDIVLPKFLRGKIYRRGADGKKYSVSATICVREYAGGGNTWKTMPYTMCEIRLEAVLWRKAYSILGGVYVEEEADEVRQVNTNENVTIENVGSKLLPSAGDELEKIKESVSRVLDDCKILSPDTIANYKTMLFAKQTEDGVRDFYERLADFFVKKGLEVKRFDELK